MDIPPVLVSNATEAWGPDAVRWLATLGETVEVVVDAWSLDLTTLFPMTFHWVSGVRCADGTPAVLKLGPPEPGHLLDQALALEGYAGHGAVRLLKHDQSRGALLLEYAAPGTPASPLVSSDDSTATAAIISVMRRLHTAPVPESLPDVGTVTRASFEGYLRRFPDAGPLPRPLVSRALGLLDELCASAASRVLLHGDLHHDNVLRAEREPWLAIDPFGVAGDPGAEVGPLLYNPDPPLRDSALVALVPSRVEQLADGLSMPEDRVVAWGFVQAVLSEVWNTEGSGDVPISRALDVALLLEPRLA